MNRKSITVTRSVNWSMLLAVFMTAFPLFAADAGATNAAPSESATAPAVEDLVGGIAATLATYFQSIQSVEFHCVRGNPDNPFATLHWMEKGDKLRYEWTQSKPFTGQTFAYDGTSFQQMNPPNGDLYISKQPFTTRQGLLSNERYFSSPFEWINPRTVQNKNDLLTLAELRAPDCFAKCLLSASNVAKTVKFSHSTIEATLPGGVDPYLQHSFTYRVFFDLEHGYYPIGFEKVDTNGNIFYRYRISQLGQVTVDGKEFYYPQQAYSSYYLKPVSVEPADRSPPNITIKDITFNNVNDSVFTLDPSVAKTVILVDKGGNLGTIQVPQ
jgi:hypothetical protein